MESDCVQSNSSSESSQRARRKKKVPTSNQEEMHTSPQERSSKRMRTSNASPLPTFHAEHFYSVDNKEQTPSLETLLPTPSQVEKRRRERCPILMFRKQREAMAHVDQFNAMSPPVSQQLQVFSFQWHPKSIDFKEIVSSVVHNFEDLFPRQREGPYRDGNGKERPFHPFQERYFIAASYISLYRGLYLRLPEEQRHMYEIIREGAPCHLYFDIECLVGQNGDGDDRNSAWRETYGGDKFGEIFLRQLNREIVQQFGHGMELRPEQVLTLVSSTERKFSKHVIAYLLDNETGQPCMFENNSHTGLFVSRWMRRLRSLRASAPDGEASKFFFVEKVPHQDDPTIDDDEDYNDNVDYDDNVNHAADSSEPLHHGREQCIVDPSVYSKNRAFRMIHSSKAGSSAFFRVCQHSTFRFDETSTDFEHFMATLITARAHHPCGKKHNDKEIKLIKLERTPEDDYRSFGTSNVEHIIPLSEDGHSFRDINDFMKQVLRSQCASAFIRKVVHSPSSGTILYHVGNYRYCENVKRQHKSNHVFMIVNIDRGCYYQKCLDPDCARFSGVEHKVPHEVLVPLRTDQPFPPIPQPMEQIVVSDEFFRAIEEAEKQFRREKQHN